MKHLTKAFVIAMLCTFVLAGMVLAKDGVDKKNQVIKVAGYDACTGKYGDYGLGDKRGQEVAVEEINAAGGIAAGPLKGYKLELQFFDDRGDPKESPTLPRKYRPATFWLPWDRP